MPMKESPISEAIQKPYEITVGRTVVNGSHLHEPPGETYFQHITSNYIVPTFLKFSSYASVLVELPRILCACPNSLRSNGCLEGLKHQLWITKRPCQFETSERDR